MFLLTNPPLPTSSCRCQDDSRKEDEKEEKDSALLMGKKQEMTQCSEQAGERLLGFAAISASLFCEGRWGPGTRGLHQLCSLSLTNKTVCWPPLDTDKTTRFSSCLPVISTGLQASSSCPVPSW